MAHILGELYSAQLENFTTANLPAAGKTGRVAYDSTEKLLKFDNGTIWVRFGFALSGSLTIANAQSALANITNCLPAADWRAYRFMADIHRKDDTQEFDQFVELYVRKNSRSNLWEVAGDERKGEPSGINFDVDSGTGQLKYTSSNLTGGNYAGNIQWGALHYFNV